jgi:hypothetical protein
MVQGLTDDEVEQLKKLGMTEDQIEEEAAKLRAGIPSDISSPTPEKFDNMLKLFREIRDTPQTDYDKISRSGNLKDNELGSLATPVRNLLDIGNFAVAMEHPAVGNHLRLKSNVWNDTSDSRSGMFIKQITTVTKVTKDMGVPKKTTQSSLFGGTKETIEGEQT